MSIGTPARRASDSINPSIHRGVGRASEPNNRFSGFSTSENMKRSLSWFPFAEAKETVKNGYRVKLA